MKYILGLLLLFNSFLTVAQTNHKKAKDLPVDFVNLFDARNTEGVACYRIPSLVTAPNGDLITAIDQRILSCGDLKYNKDINIVVRRSIDNGKTWSPIEKIVDYPLGQSASDPSMIVDQVTKEIFLFFNYMDLNLEKDIYYLRFIKSADDGKSWSKPVDITSQISMPEWKNDFKFITSGRGIQTNNGTLIHNVVNLKHGLFLFSSDDHGKNWNLLPSPITPADESKMVELVDGTWMVNSRVNNLGYRYLHLSTDQGKTWESKVDTILIDPSCNASIIRYTSVKNGDDKNRLLFANPKMKNNRENMTIRVSYDEGKTWTAGKTIFGGSSAYSSMTILKNGKIGLFFEKDDYKENVFVSVDLTWLTDGKDNYKKPKKPKI